MVMYADDTTLYCSLGDLSEDIINTELTKVSEWLAANKLSLNVKKTKCMVFHRPQRKVTYPEIKINNILIERVSEFNFLGITFNSNLKWHTHINYITKKITGIVGLLWRIKYLYPMTVLRMLYNSLILPHLSYGILTWGAKISMDDKLHLIQKRYLRIISNSSYIAHTEPICKDLRIISLPDMYSVAMWKFYYKYPAYVVESDIVAIRSPKHVLSNFYTCTVKMFNQEFTSSEQAYQWRFAKYVELDDITAEIMASRTPAEAKDIASRIPRHLHRDWHSFKHCVMREVLHAKADSCPRFKQELIQTGDRKLVEATRDLFWASGLSPKESASTQPGYYPGLNQLGRVLERVRHELTEEEARIEALNGDEAEKQKQPPQSVRHSTVTRASNDSTQRTRDDPTIQAPDHSARLATDDLIIQAPDNSDRDEADVSTILAPDNTGRHNPDDPTIQAPDDPARHALSNPTNHVPDDPALHVPDDPTINVPDNPTKHVPDDLTEPAPDAMTSPPLIDAIENPSNTSDMIITDSDSSCSELDISGVTKLESTPESAVCSGATDAVPKHRPILKPHGRKNVKDSTGSNLVQTTLSSFLGKMISKRKLTPGKETDTTQENSKSQPNDT